MRNTTIAIPKTRTARYPEPMSEVKKSYPMRATPSWAAMVKAQAQKETRPAGNLIERVMVAYCGDPAIRELVRKYEDRTPD